MDRYNKITMIGKGTFGSAWLVESKLSGYRYAVKELSVQTMPAADRHLALNEVKILSTLKHKNIVRYKNAFEENSNFYIVMEYAEGGDLYSKIKQSKILFPQEQILNWLTQLLLALKHIHGLNILHRDLKTQNIFLTKSDVIKLGDFGIARILGSTNDHAQTTVGTPYYLSPEICQRQPYNQKSDMWALGCVLYEITTLKHPFTADCFSSLVVKILHGKYAAIPREYGPLLEDFIGVLLRSNPEDRPSAKQLIHVPAMKNYVEKYAVIQRERIDSTVVEQTQSKIQNEVDKNKRKVEENNQSWKTKEAEQVKRMPNELEKETNERDPKCSLKPPQECGIQERSILKIQSEKITQKREKAYSVNEVSYRVRTSDPPVTAHASQERRAGRIKSAVTSNIQHEGKKTAVRSNVLKTELIPVESSGNIRRSILKGHERRRRCSADSGLRVADVEINSKSDKTKVRCQPKRDKVYSDIVGSSNDVTDVQRDVIHEKTRNRKCIVDKELKINQTMKTREKSVDGSVCSNELNEDEVLSLKENLIKEEYRSSLALKYEKNEQKRKVTASVESKTTARLFVVEEDESSDTTSSNNDEDGITSNVQATRIKPRYQIISQKKSNSVKGCIAIKSRDRTASTPCVSEARARRRAARESLNYHMNHCRRIRAKSSKSASTKALNKENLYPGTRQQTGLKAQPKRNAAILSKEKELQKAMVNPTPEFKRCQTYKVAQFRRLPLMSVPDVTRNADTEVVSDRKLNQPSCNERHKSDSTFLNPKLTVTKFSGLRGAHIDRARRRARKMSAAVEVGSSRREFSVNPDGACATSNKSQPKISCESKNNISCPSVTTNIRTKAEEINFLDSFKETSSIKFKFGGETLHLNTTDAKSVFAHMEALRVFLEEHLGTRRFIEAYQYLNDSFFLSDEEKKLDCNIRHIIGKENTEYLPLLYQLIASETNHFGTRV